MIFRNRLNSEKKYVDDKKEHLRAAKYFIPKISKFIAIITGIVSLFDLKYSSPNFTFNVETEFLLPVLPAGFALDFIKKSNSTNNNYFSPEEGKHLLFSFVSLGIVIPITFVLFNHFLLIKKFIWYILATLLTVPLFIFLFKLYKKKSDLCTLIGLGLTPFIFILTSIFFLYASISNKENYSFCKRIPFSYSNFNSSFFALGILTSFVITTWIAIKFSVKAYQNNTLSNDFFKNVPFALDCIINIFIFLIPFISLAGKYECVSNSSTLNILKIYSYIIAVILYSVYLSLDYIHSAYIDTNKKEL